MKLSEIIKQYRKINNISAREFAKRCEISNAYISLIENEETKSPTLEMLNKLANGMFISLNELIQYIDDETMVSIKPIKKTSIKIPVLGKVIAGIPIEAVEEILDYEEIDEKMARTGEFFALQIKGDSMDPIMSAGDVVIVRKQSDVDNGQIGIILINGDEATVKKVIKKENGIMLVANNPMYEPMFFDAYDIQTKPVKIIGRVIELRKKF